MFSGLDPSAGRFRAFLLASIKNFLSNQRARESAEKRRAAHCSLAMPGLMILRATLRRTGSS